jgi:hypothetical protein
MIIRIITAKHRLILAEYLVQLLHTALQLRILALQILNEEVLVLEVIGVVIQERAVRGLVGRPRALEQLLEGYLFTGGIRLRVHMGLVYFVV